MNYILVFLLGFIFSFIGSIPPGTLNIAILQLSLENKVKTALRFAIAVSIVEYPYAWIGVQFESFISSSPIMVDNFQLMAAVVMTVIGIYNLLPRGNRKGLAKKISESGFRRGMILSILNPMAIVYWMAFTAYLKAQGWISLTNQALVHLYVLGASAGTMALLSLLIFFSHRLSSNFHSRLWVRRISGILLLGLGAYAWWKYFL